MYAQDSFFDLSPWGQVGLAAISAALFLAMILLAWSCLRQRVWWVRIIGALLMFWAFVWLSPQVYYMYYRVLIPDLPLQWVVKPFIPPQRLFELLTFQYRANLSAHGQGLLGWGLLLIPFVPSFKRRTGA